MTESINNKQIKIENAYGSHRENWGDLPVFRGDYINFGYWKDISVGEEITVENRIKSSAALYKYVIDNLHVSIGDTVLELGCGRAMGMLDAVEYMDMSKIIGIDFSRPQIERAKVKKNKKENQNHKESLKAERVKQDLESLEKQLNLTLDNIHHEMEEFIQEIKILSKKITLLSTSQKSTIFDKPQCPPEKETGAMQFQQEWIKNLQDGKQKVNKIIEEKNEIAKKLNEIEFSVASADAIGLADNIINKIYSIEVFQHIEDFNALAAEMKRVLTPDGIISFCAHLSTSRISYDKLRQEKLLIDEIEILAPVDEVVSAFKGNGFNVEYHSIGTYVFDKYEQWVTQINNNQSLDSIAKVSIPDPSHNIYESYKAGYIDYYVFTMNKLSGEISSLNAFKSDQDAI
jgi:ubiquinone/menaquinone biosynthesis C-methylase UbiE